MQTRGPYENGCDASRSSPDVSPNQRSGLNVKGSLKLAVDIEAAKGFVDTVICGRYRQFHPVFATITLWEVNSRLLESYARLL
jgi:hypothetical protein